MTDEQLFEQTRDRAIDDAFAAFKEDFHAFLDGSIPNRYVYGDDIIAVYMRKGHHGFLGAVFETLDIARISVSEEYRNLGIGTRVIDYIHNNNPRRCTFVESILNQSLYDRLTRQHWKDVPCSHPPSLYMLRPLKG